MDSLNLGIVGNGFVGNAVYQKFKNYYEVFTYDIQAMLCNSTIEEVCQCDHIFICLPTPMDKEGKCHIGIVEETLAFVDKHSKAKTAIIKSTVVPGTTRSIKEEYKNLRIAFNPEFLTERHARFDFLNQSRIIMPQQEIIDIFNFLSLNFLHYFIFFHFFLSLLYIYNLKISYLFI